MSVLQVLAPLYVAIGLGYVAVRTGFVPAEALPVIGGFVVKVALPGLLFGVLATRRIAEVVHPVYLIAYALGSLVAFGLAYAWTRRAAVRADVEEPSGSLRAAYFALGAGTSNSGYVGFPVLQGIAPSVAAPVFGMNVLVENLITIPLGMALAERAAGGHVGRAALIRGTLSRLARTPMIIAIVLGAFVSVVGLPVPDVVQRVATMFGQATTAPALFIIGGSLVGQRAADLGRVAPMVVGKLLLHPLAVAGAVYGLMTVAPPIGLPPLPPALQAAAIICACAPTIAIFPIIAARHGQEEIASIASFVATLVSLPMLSVVILLLQPMLNA